MHKYFLVIFYLYLDKFGLEIKNKFAQYCLRIRERFYLTHGAIIGSTLRFVQMDRIPSALGAVKVLDPPTCHAICKKTYLLSSTLALLHRRSAMDSLLLSSSSSSFVPKRPCPRDPLAANGPRVPSDTASMDRLLESFLSLSDPSLALDLSLERLIGSRVLESDKDCAIEGAIRVGSALLEAAKRSARKRASKHNSASWPLPPDLTIKVLYLSFVISLLFL